ncbi:hypothetical protein [Wolbachia pipientis]|uniref:hypothetical protein n=1 Tax=Wolbachia pipientis TaxID=955 RepID=UPI0025A34F86|nr:hypothetical protein [Wolbachia pipientis]MDM8335710.1 hypothetical protein [Wolbachia pipientis]
MHDQQFAEFLNKLNAKNLKDIIHKLPHEKAIPMIDTFCKNNQFRNVLDMIKGKLENQNKQTTEVI